MSLFSSGRGFLPGRGTGRGETHRQANPEPEAGEEAAFCVPADGDHIALVGENRRLLVFPLEQIPEMMRGAGVILQRYKDGGLSDAKVFRLADGLTSAARGTGSALETDLREWLGERAQAGRMPPNGFPRGLKF